MAAKLEFTDDEHNVLYDATFFINKRKVTDKLVAYFGDINTEIEKLLLQYADRLPPEVVQSKGRINRGENYEHQPYILLDCPRMFTPDHVFAFRTMFRWGNYFSCTVQLAGKYLERFRPEIVKFMSEQKNNHYYICTGDDEWQHHFRTDNYTPALEVLKDKSMSNAVKNQSFFKVAIQIPLTKYNQLLEDALEFYKSFLDFYV